MSRRRALQAIALAVPAAKFIPGYAFGQAGDEVQDGLFRATRESLKSYVIPEWFRDAKFGIWAHWGPQSAIEDGDWYARNMYMEGSDQYKHFVQHYGHQSKTGYKDTIPNWKAEKFDPDYLVGLYKKAGAKYFMSMGVHHDNFDLWNSKHNGWNAVKMGPRIDIVGMWKKATQKHGLKFGVSDHLWISPKWFSTSKGADKDGPYAGMPYDGADPANFSLYGTSPKIYTDLSWNEDGIPESWKKHWFMRIKDLVDNYQPDLLYCDGAIPFEEYGLGILARLYNQSAAKNGGITQSVYTSKRAEDSQVGTCVYDVERGVVDSIWPRPWQTDTCIGDWHYNRNMIGHYKTPKTIVDMLVDIVSRNGNLMLNFPLPASGMLDSDELNTLDGITKWMAVNSEAIYATRPWKIYGESPKTDVPTGTSFNESKRQDLTFNDIRFTAKGKTLYTFFMGWPQNSSILIKPLAENNAQQTGKIENIELLGYGKVEFTRDNEGLKVNLPSQKPCDHAYALKLSGTDLT
ncbi:MAG TPA: alpha-L-fucosidase [Mucilaginibacter sp.]|nr:alpha-L-fucosidase [Mucilaginibacter sp.]